MIVYVIPSPKYLILCQLCRIYFKHLPCLNVLLLATEGRTTVWDQGQGNTTLLDSVLKVG